MWNEKRKNNNSIRRISCDKFISIVNGELLFNVIFMFAAHLLSNLKATEKRTGEGKNNEKNFWNETNEINHKKNSI